MEFDFFSLLPRKAQTGCLIIMVVFVIALLAFGYVDGVFV